MISLWCTFIFVFFIDEYPYILDLWLAADFSDFVGIIFRRKINIWWFSEGKQAGVLKNEVILKMR